MECEYATDVQCVNELDLVFREGTNNLQQRTAWVQRDIDEINYVLGMYPYNKLREKYGRYGRFQIGVKRGREGLPVCLVK